MAYPCFYNYCHKCQKKAAKEEDNFSYNSPPNSVKSIITHAINHNLHKPPKNFTNIITEYSEKLSAKWPNGRPGSQHHTYPPLPPTSPPHPSSPPNHSPAPSCFHPPKQEPSTIPTHTRQVRQAKVSTSRRSTSEESKKTRNTDWSS